MKSFIGIIVLLGVLTATAASAAGPRLAVTAPEFSFGEIWQGVRLTHVFRIRNGGDAPLLIDRVRTSCGCTAALLSERRLAPGDVAQLRVTFDSRRFVGPVVKSISLFSNDPLRHVAKLTLRGRVRAQVRFEPSSLNFGVVPPGKPSDLRVRITNTGDRTLDFNFLQRTTSEVAVTLSRKRLTPGESAALNVTMTPRKTGRGRRLDGYILLRADGLRVPELSLPFYAVVSAGNSRH
jgi:hypothetical protein